MNHKWKNDTCVHCRIRRAMKTRKLLMAITDRPPYNHYKWDRIYFYYDLDGQSMGWIRPKCTK